jgi:hypothetical protein
MGTDLTRQRRPSVWARLRGHGVCLHHALIGVGDHTGRCLEYGAAVPTPFTLQSC